MGARVAPTSPAQRRLRSGPPAGQARPPARRRRVPRILPRGPRDFGLQLLLFMIVNVIYEVTRGLSDGDIVSAFDHARDLVAAERALGIFTELDVQAFALEHRWALTVANWTYFNAHFAVTVGFLLWAYLRRTEHYTFLRNTIFIADAFALAGYIFYPTAPPRMLTDLGFVDTLDRFASVNHSSGLIGELANPFAAVPSVHSCYALVFGTAGVLLARRLVFKAVWAAYPALIIYSIVATANHFWLDAVAGAAIAVVAFLLARRLEAARPTLPASARQRLRLPAAPARLQGAGAARAR